MPLTKVVIGGFRSIKETAVIPLAPVTMMFGPNSAGKTSVLRGLELLREVLTARLEGVNLEHFPSVRTFHRLGADHRSTDLTLGAELVNCIIQCDTQALGWAALAAQGMEGGVGIDVLDYRFTLDRAMETSDKWRLAFGGEELFSVHLARKRVAKELPPLWFPFDKQLLLLNLESPWITQLPSVGRLIRKLKSPGLAAPYLKHIRVEDQQCAIPLWVHRGRLMPWGEDPVDDGRLDDFLEELSASERKAFHLADPYVAAVCEELNAVIDAVERAMIQQLDILVVPGGRGLMTREQLTFPLRDPVFKVRSLSDALALYANWLFNSATDSWLPEKLRARNDFVNEALTHGLFGKRTYQFYPVATRILESSLSLHPGGRAKKKWSEPSQMGGDCALVLQDGQQRALNIEEVGSGVSYVLPVLVALWDARLSWVEQPELHLHPAAQCEMADVFIKAFHQGHFSVIETHSEHLLLRLLRRVRETHADQQPVPTLRCPAEAVCVLYFDPQDDGSTHVHHLRVSRSGDFLDQWPAGFFEERYRELFDE